MKEGDPNVNKKLKVTSGDSREVPVPQSENRNYICQFCGDQSADDWFICPKCGKAYDPILAQDYEE